MPRTRSHLVWLPLVAMSLACGAVVAAEPTAPKTVMATPGAEILSDDLSAMGKGWRAAKGEWTAADGALRGAERPADHHGAVTRHAVEFDDAVIAVSFRLDGAKSISLSINDAGGHCCRVIITSKGFSVRKDDHDHAGADKAVNFATKEVAFKPGEWHTLVLEIVGGKMLARIGDDVGYGEHAMIDVGKTNIGLTVAGQSAAFRDLRVWAAELKPDFSPGSLELTRAR